MRKLNQTRHQHGRVQLVRLMRDNGDIVGRVRDCPENFGRWFAEFYNRDGITSVGYVFGWKTEAEAVEWVEARAAAAEHTYPVRDDDDPEKILFWEACHQESNTYFPRNTEAEAVERLVKHIEDKHKIEAWRKKYFADQEVA